MAWLRCSAIRWVGDEPQPGWVEVHIALADGSIASVFDKPPVLDDGDRLHAGAAYPIELQLACDVLEDHGDELVIALHHGVGEGPYRVRASAISSHSRNSIG
jgi:hypothetical protein